LREITELREALKPGAPVKIVITTHHKPDADAIGSSLGLFNFFKLYGISDVHVVSPTDYGAFLQWMPGNESVIIYEEKPEQSRKLVEEADYIFCLDFNSLKRINQLGEFVGSSKAKKVMIDHHLDPEAFDDYRLISTKVSSTCELIYQFIRLWDAEHLVNKDIASCIYSGIMTDTASFKHNSTTPDTHRIAAQLIEKGADAALIHTLIYDSYSYERMKFIGYALYEKLQYFPEYKTALITISREEIKKFHIVTGDTEGLVNYGLGIADAELAVLIIDRTVRVKMSFRSKTKFPANEMAKKYFNGGGHFHAAGGESGEPMEQVVAKFKEVLPEFKQYLQ
jgi:bifunctional oligoribonuclease and PAP phosphatase NrnA